jgi:hypothetical protein
VGGHGAGGLQPPAQDPQGAATDAVEAQSKPLPKNSALQRQLAAINLKVEFDVLDQNTLRHGRSA